MATPVFATQSLLASAVITCGDRASTTPPGNVALPEPSDNLILTSDSTAYVVIDLGQAYAVKVLAAIYVGAIDTMPTTMRWRGATTQAGLTSSPGFDGTALAFASGNVGLPHRKKTVHDFLLPAAAQTYRWWRIDFNKKCSIGNLIIDTGWFPSRSYKYGSELPWLNDPSVVKTGLTGRDSVRELPGRDLSKVTLEALSKAEAIRGARDLMETVGVRIPVLAILDPDEVTYRQEMMTFGRITATMPVSNPYFQYFAMDISIKELIP